MKYKVWGKAKAVLKPQKHHFEAVAVIAFVAALSLAVFIAFRLAFLYSGTIYSGITEPYMQAVGSHQATIRWQSDQRVQAKIEIRDKENLVFEFEEERALQMHEITAKGLKPATQYYYRLYHDNAVFREGDEYWFKTAPEAGSNTPVRFWVLGDPGHSGNVIESIKSSASQWLENHKREGLTDIDLIISTGDSAYESGTKEEYQNNLFSVHQSLIKNFTLWPVYGNHDAKGWSFFNLFTLPVQGELGGLASSTEHYYSFDYGNIHFVFLDSNEGAYQEDDEMLAWLHKDLQQNKQQWLVALMHHPAYSKGSHNSNDPRDSGNRMFNMRKRVLPVLEKAGVDLVIAGHSHSYERSHLIDCHYGLTSDFSNSSVVQAGSEFTKPDQQQPHSGTVYMVLGSSAEAIDSKLDHPAMAASNAEAGSVMIDVVGNQLEARFIDSRSKQLDKFVITKTAQYDVRPDNKNACN